MNWGYAATKEGFVHAVTRGQYEKINTDLFDITSGPSKLLAQSST
jgi:hypothetical protein